MVEELVGIVQRKSPRQPAGLTENSSASLALGELASPNATEKIQLSIKTSKAALQASPKVRPVKKGDGSSFDSSFVPLDFFDL